MGAGGHGDGLGHLMGGMDGLRRWCGGLKDQ